MHEGSDITAPAADEKSAHGEPAQPHPTFGEAFRFWLKLGFISFGGPTGQIAIMHTELVEKRRWISESRFLHALNYCMLLPGPEAQQLATYIGWLLHRTAGGLVAGGLFVLPAFFILWLLAFVYAVYGNVPWVAALFYGLQPAVMAVVAFAVIRIGQRVLKNGVMWAIGAAAFIAIFFLGLPFPLIILSAGLVGYIGGRLGSSRFLVIKGHRRDPSAFVVRASCLHQEGGLKPAPQPHGRGAAPVGATPTGPPPGGGAVLGDDVASPEHTRPNLGRAAAVCTLGVFLWFTPILAVGAWQGWDGTLFHEGLFFSKAAMVTFGGAYAVLPYVAQQAVERFAWVTPEQMLTGLGLAETTPGPLIMVVQFVGFLGAWSHPGSLSPLAAGTLGAIITTWATFVPCFLWIFLGAPYIEQMRENRRLQAALSAITAAVVGVVLNLAVWFAMHVVLPEPGVVDWFAIAVAAAAFTGMLRWKWDIVPVVIGSGLLGLVYRLA